MNDQHKCSKEGEIATLKNETKMLFKEIEGLKKIQNVIYELSTNMSLLVIQMKDTKEDVKNIKGDLEEIKKQPMDNYNYYKRQVVAGVFISIISFIMGLIFKGL